MKTVKAGIENIRKRIDRQVEKGLLTAAQRVGSCRG